jgi:HD-GYP domain-containing protein (c-di-GMP phosphodiesterase class II)
MKEVKFSFARLAAANSAETPRAVRPAAAAPASHRRELHAQACACLAQIFGDVRAKRPFSLEPAASLIGRMAAERPQPDALFALALHLDEPRNFPLHHGVNVAVYAVKMAQDLGFDEEHQVQIGLAGLLHDVGIALLPDALLHKKGPLADAELSLLRERPNSAARILQCLGPAHGSIAESAAQVYERIDGSGLPRGLAGDEIHEYAQIIGLLDLYEALVHSRPNRERLSFFDAVKYIFKSCKTQFQRRYMKSLLRVFTVFPIGSYVQLNSEAVGRVIETVPDEPMRPKLRILFDSQRRQVLAERAVALTEAPLLNVVRSVTAKEIRELRLGTAALSGPGPATCETVEAPIL